MNHQNKANDLKDSVVASESERQESYSDEEANTAVVRLRQDMILVYSMLSSAADYLASIRLIMVLILCVLVFIAAKLM